MKITGLILSTISAVAAFTPVPWVDPNSNPNPPQRLDIDTLFTRKEQWNLYVLATRRFQSMSASDPTSWYQVCGIHGAPFTTWDQGGSGGVSSFTGYCWHGSQNFIMWHRPYLTLFENSIIKAAKNIADNWGNSAQKAKYQAAAATLRMPYWDWAKGSGGAVPSYISSQTLSNIPNPTTGQNQPSIPNPLYSHTLVTGPQQSLGNSIFVGVSGSRGTTYRRNTYITDMRNNGPSLRRWTALLFNTANVCWNAMATDDDGERSISACRNSQTVNSLESIHNSVHNTVAGTMANLATAAYDPIFWLHHTNVDRIAAIWQGLNPNTKIIATRTDAGTFATKDQLTLGDNYALRPFRWANTAGDWWQPKWLYDTRTNSYTYPEIADRPSVATLQARVNAIYGNGRTQTSLSSGGAKRKARRSDYIAHLKHRRDLTAGDADLTAPPPTSALAPIADSLIANNGSFEEYTAKVSINPSIVNGVSFNLHLFFGDPANENAKTHSDYLADSNRIGGFAVSQATGMKMNKFVVGYATITDALLHVRIVGDIKDMDPKTVRTYCRAKLTWRLVTADGTDIKKQAVRDGRIKIRILHQVITPEGQNSAPEASVPTEIIDNTNSTNAKPLPSGVAATTVTASATDAATAVGPVPVTSETATE